MDAAAGMTPLTIDEVMADLEHGRTSTRLPLHDLTSQPRPTLGGRTFRRALLISAVLGRLHPRLVRRALLRLWLTPWVHPAALAPVTVDHDAFTEWSAHVEGTRLRGFAGGEGPTVVLVHGWAGRAADWRHLAVDLIEAGWRIVAPDLPAHGMTAGQRTNLFDLGRAVAAVLGTEQPAAVVTHSMGFPALMLALESDAPAPQRIVALAPGRKMARAVEGFAARVRLRPRIIAELRRGLQSVFGPDVWDVLDVDRVLPSLAVDGVVIHDRDDDEVPVSDAQHIADAWPGATLVETSGLGHRKILRDAQVHHAIVSALAPEPEAQAAEAGRQQPAA